MPMNVVSRTTLESFWKQHSTAKGPLSKWYSAASHATWTCFADVRQTFGSADFVHQLVVFDVGNGLRVIADVFYPGRHVYIKHVFTHADYDRWTKRNQGKP